MSMRSAREVTDKADSVAASRPPKVTSTNAATTKVVITRGYPGRVVL